MNKGDAPCKESPDLFGRGSPNQKANRAQSASQKTLAATGTASTIAGRAQTHGAAQTTNRIVRFTNSLGEVNHGIIIDRDPGGMVQVMFDTFGALIARLEEQRTIKDFELRSLDKHIGWIRVDAHHPHGATCELLPIETVIQWHDAELATRQEEIQGG